MNPTITYHGLDGTEPVDLLTFRNGEGQWIASLHVGPLHIMTERCDTEDDALRIVRLLGAEIVAKGLEQTAVPA